MERDFEIPCSSWQYCRLTDFSANSLILHLKQISLKKKKKKKNPWDTIFEFLAWMHANEVKQSHNEVWLISHTHSAEGFHGILAWKIIQTDLVDKHFTDHLLFTFFRLNFSLVCCVFFLCVCCLFFFNNKRPVFSESLLWMWEIKGL